MKNFTSLRVLGLVLILNATSAVADCKIHLIGTINKSPAMMPVSWEINDVSGELIKLIPNRQSQVIELACNATYTITAKCNGANRLRKITTVTNALVSVPVEFGG